MVKGTFNFKNLTNFVSGVLKERQAADIFEKITYEYTGNEAPIAKVNKKRCRWST